MAVSTSDLGTAPAARPAWWRRPPPLRLQRAFAWAAVILGAGMSRPPQCATMLVAAPFASTVTLILAPPPSAENWVSLSG